jgi:hypothetical protein
VGREDVPAWELEFEPQELELGLLAFSEEQQEGLPSCCRKVPRLRRRHFVLNARIKGQEKGIGVRQHNLKVAKFEGNKETQHIMMIEYT